MLNALQKALKDGSNLLRGAMKEAYDKASIAAEAIKDFAHEHPLYTAAICVVVALGILVILTPVIIHALGFTAAGVEAGEFVWFVWFVWLFVLDPRDNIQKGKLHKRKLFLLMWSIRFLGRGVAVNLWRGN